MLAIVDGLTIVALSRYSKNDNTARQDPDHFGTYIYRSFFDARLRLSRLSPFLPILFFPRFLLFLPLFPRFNSFSTSPPPTGRGSKGSLVPTENKKVKFSCAFAALSLPYKNNATWHFQRGCLVSSCVLRLAFPRLYIFPRCFLFETLDERVYDFPFKSNRCFSSNCQPFKKSDVSLRGETSGICKGILPPKLFSQPYRVATLQSDHEAPDGLVAPFKTIETFLSSIKYVFPAKEADARSSFASRRFTATSLIAHFPLNTRLVSCLHALSAARCVSLYSSRRPSLLSSLDRGQSR